MSPPVPIFIGGEVHAAGDAVEAMREGHWHAGKIDQVLGPDEYLLEWRDGTWGNRIRSGEDIRRASAEAPEAEATELWRPCGPTQVSAACDSERSLGAPSLASHASLDSSGSCGPEVCSAWGGPASASSRHRSYLSDETFVSDPGDDDSADFAATSAGAAAMAAPRAQVWRLDRRRSSDMGFELLASLPSTSRGEEAAEQRSALRMALVMLDKDLDETAQGLKLCPSKADKLTAANYHACFRFLHMALDRCQRLQEQAETLESYDSSRLADAGISSEYAFLAVEIVARHDRAHTLLQALCKPQASAAPTDEQPTAVGPGALLSRWFGGALTACSSRSHDVCMNRTAAGANSAPASPRTPRRQ